MSLEQVKVLEMLYQRIISVSEAIDLLQALPATEPAPIVLEIEVVKVFTRQSAENLLPGTTPVAALL